MDVEGNSFEKEVGIANVCPALTRIPFNNTRELFVYYVPRTWYLGLTVTSQAQTAGERGYHASLCTRHPLSG